MASLGVSRTSWRHANVLITGCTGLLGSWLTEALIEREANVVGIVRDWVPRSRLLSGTARDAVIVARGSIEDFPFIERVLNEYEIEVVFHVAAQAIVGTSNRNPLSTFESNIRGTWTVLEACRRVATVRRVLVASSDKAYGAQPELPYTEAMPLQGEHPYDVSKSCADLIARSYFATYGLPVCVTRCGNFYGGGDLNFNRIVPGTIRSIYHDEPPIIRSDGSLIRDYIYVEDAVLAYLTLAEKMAELPIAGETFNFSNEIHATVIDLVDRIRQLMKRPDLAPVVLGEAKNEIAYQYLSAQKAREVLGWRPAFDLTEGLRRTIDWYSRFFEKERRNSGGAFATVRGQ